MRVRRARLAKAFWRLATADPSYLVFCSRLSIFSTPGGCIGGFFFSPPSGFGFFVGAIVGGLVIFFGFVISGAGFVVRGRFDFVVSIWAVVMVISAGTFVVSSEMSSFMSITGMVVLLTLGAVVSNFGILVFFGPRVTFGIGVFSCFGFSGVGISGNRTRKKTGGRYFTLLEIFYIESSNSGNRNLQKGI